MDRFEREALVHLNSVYRVALSITGNEMEAQDLVQEVMLKAFRFFSSYRDGTNCKAWLIKILVNTAINQRRKQRRDSILLEDLNAHQALTVSASTSSENPEKSAVRSATREQIKGALAKIPEEYRNAVILCDIEELSYKEISEILSCPIGTVMSRLFRGRRMLRERLLRMNSGEDRGAQLTVVQLRRKDKDNDL